MARPGLLILCACAHATAPARSDRVQLRIDPSEAEAEAALAIAAGPRPPARPALHALLAGSGIRRLKAREASMQRALDDDTLVAFVTSADLAARGPALRDTLQRWTAADVDAIAARVLPYLPIEARIAATVYPVIKPQPNSFVYFDDAGAAVFVSLDPQKTAAQFTNTVAHELHHIGFASLRDEPCHAPPAICQARKWTSAFGEGFAMLAAAGNPDTHPHQVSPADDRLRWDRDVAQFDDNLHRVAALLEDITAARIDDDTAQQRAMAFFGIQGPWYTVGWSMAVAIERCLGRSTLVEAMRRPWTVLGRYNQARRQCPANTGAATATWNDDLVRALEAS